MKFGCVTVLKPARWFPPSAQFFHLGGMLLAGLLLISLLMGGLVSGFSGAHANEFDTITTGTEVGAPKHLRIFTHGDTRLAQFDKDGTASGKAVDALRCAAPTLDIKYDFDFAPLSRSAALLDSQDHMVWFPSGPSDDPERQKRMIGPFGKIDILWYQMNSSPHQVTTETFIQDARVTAYKGSMFEGILKRDGYKFIDGSADHNRLIYRLMSGEVDALLAVDFRFTLPEETKQLIDARVRTTVMNSFPVYMTMSRRLADEHPEFAEALRSALMACDSEKIANSR